METFCCSVCARDMPQTYRCRGMCCACYTRLRRHGVISKIDKPILPISLTPEQSAYINGSLLGDGHINYYSGTGNASFRKLRSQKDKSYLEWERQFLIDFCTPSSKVFDSSIFDTRTNKYYYHSRFHTRSCSLFGELYEKWYPNGIKIVPRDLELTPLTMAIWFLDDGGISIKGNKPHLFEIKIATDGFLEQDVEFLAHLLQERYNEYFAVCKHEKHFIINAATMASRAIIKDIDPYIPKEIMERKTIKWRNSLSKINEDIFLGGNGKLKEQRFLQNFNEKLQNLFKSSKSFTISEIGEMLECFKSVNGQICINRDKVLGYLEKYLQNNLITQEKIGRKYVYSFTKEFMI
jgi:hypothetical protein